MVSPSSSSSSSSSEEEEEEEDGIGDDGNTTGVVRAMEDPSIAARPQRRRPNRKKSSSSSSITKISKSSSSFLERYAMWSHRHPILAFSAVVLVAAACVLTVVMNDELEFVETNDREWVILKDGITSDADAASEGTRLVEEYVVLLLYIQASFRRASYRRRREMRSTRSLRDAGIVNCAHFLVFLLRDDFVRCARGRRRTIIVWLSLSLSLSLF
jgi:hypothetical protein